jgi:hypothetical protein
LDVLLELYTSSPDEEKKTVALAAAVYAFPGNSWKCWIYIFIVEKIPGLRAKLLGSFCLIFF